MPPKKLFYRNVDDLVTLMDTLPSDTADTAEETEVEDEERNSNRHSLMRQIAQKKLKSKQKTAASLKPQTSDSSAYDYSDSETEVTFNLKASRKRYGSVDAETNTPTKIACMDSPLAKGLHSSPGISRAPANGSPLASTSRTSTPSHRNTPAANIPSSPIPDSEAENVSQVDNDMSDQSGVEADDEFGDEADDEFLDEPSDIEQGEGGGEESDPEEDNEPIQLADPRPLHNYLGDRIVQKDTQDGWLDSTIHIHDTTPPIPPFDDPDGGELMFDTDNFEPLEYFYQMFPKSLFDDIAAETNRFHASGMHKRRHGK